MEIVYDDDQLSEAVEAMSAVGGALSREGGVTRDRPVLIDRFLEDAIEVDVDALRDATGEVMVCGVMEHVEAAGIHSGDSACALPPQTLSDVVVDELEHLVRVIAEALQVRGPCNVQFAVKDDRVFVLEANPRASRTVPFVAKATGVPVAMAGARIMVGATIDELRTEGLLPPPVTGHVSVKEAVLPFDRFPDVDTLLGPEMRSTGEVMGMGDTFGLAFAKSQLAAGSPLPSSGTVFLSLADRDKAVGLEAARQFAVLGFELAATSGTAEALERAGVPVATRVAKVGQSQPGMVDAVDLIAEGKVQLVVNTPRGRGPRADGIHIRNAALVHQVPCLTTVAAARAAAAGITDWIRHPLSVRSLQEYHRRAEV
jgi:carbamoyl-phosphate synthase large subunit